TVGAVLMTVALGLGGQSAVAVPGAAPGSGDGPAGGAVVVPPGTPPNPAAPRPYFPADVTQIPATESLPTCSPSSARRPTPTATGPWTTRASGRPGPTSSPTRCSITCTGTSTP